MDRGADTIDFAFRVIWPDQSVRCLEGAAQILYDGAGAPLRMIGVNIDVTARREAERTLQLQAMLLDRMTEGVSLSSEDGTIVYTNKAEDELFGYARGELIGKHVSIQNAYPPDENHARVAAVIEALKRDGAWTGDWNNRRKDGSEFITSSSITMVEIDGRRHFLCVQRDVQEERRLEQQQRERDIRLQMAMSASGFGDWAWDVASDEMRLSDQAASLFGLAENTCVKWAGLKRLVHPEDRAYVDAAVEAAAQADEPFSVEHRINRADTGETRWLALRGRTTRYPDGQVQGMSGVLRDATDEHLARERERLLAREVDHRAKNALAVVQSLVRLTPFTSKDEYVATIAGRVDAMARVHTLLSQNAWSGATLGQIVTQELAAFSGEGRLAIEGPEIQLRLEAAQPFSLLIHELSTNAAKHGALSVPQGKVTVRWSKEGDGSVAVTWVETGGPVASKPQRFGFGTKLIKGSARQLAGHIEKEWAPAGLRCRLLIGALQTQSEIHEQSLVTPQPAKTEGLKGARVLLVEDEVLLAMETANHLESVGAIPVGPANTLDVGMALASSGEFDCAVLDLNLGGFSAEPLVELLKARNTPFVVVTGYETTEFTDVVVLRKPVNHTELVRALANQLEIQEAQVAPNWPIIGST
jgi:PAS domain S-box-containing protein